MSVTDAFHGSPDRPTTIQAVLEETLANIRVIEANHNTDEKMRLGFTNQAYPKARSEAEDTILFNRLRLAVAEDVIYGSNRLYKEGIEREYEQRVQEVLAEWMESQESAAEGGGE